MIENLNGIIFSEEFRSRHRKNEKDFTRNRLLSFHTLIHLLINMNNQSYQSEIDRYFQVVIHLEVADRILYKGNLSKARAKLKYEAFVQLNEHMTNFYYKNFESEKWNGFNLLAVDGTTIRVPNEKEIVKHFGVWKSKKGKKPCPMARASQMFDVLNKITIDAIIKPKSDGELELASFHFLKLKTFYKYSIFSF